MDTYSISQVPHIPPTSFFSETDMEHLGAQRFEPDYAYRACDIQDSTADIICGAPDSDRSIEQHIHAGAKYPSRFISATPDLAVAVYWATRDMASKGKALRDTPRDIIKIHMSKIRRTPEGDYFVDLTNTKVRNHFLRHPIHQNYAIKAQEVLFYRNIPANAYEVLRGYKEPGESVDELTKAMGKAQI